LGLIIYIADGVGFEKEVSRVAWARRDSANPDAAFSEKLDEELQKAEEAAEVANKYQQEADEAARVAAQLAQRRLDEILGRPPDVYQ